MGLTRRDYFKTFTILGLSMCAMEGFRFLGSALYRYVLTWLTVQEAGVFRWFSALFTSVWTDMLVQYAFVFGLSYLAVILVVRWVPKVKLQRGWISPGHFMTLFIISMGVGYVLNFAGGLVNIAVSLMTGKLFVEMNPVIDMMSDMTPSMLIYACLLGPFMEEVMFRKILLSRARWFGDRTAVIFCAVLFGLMHGNLTQFLYATAVGLIFGYVAVITNTIKYSVLMHIMLNSYSTLLVLGESAIAGLGMDLPLVGYSFAILAAVGLFVAAAVWLLIKYAAYGSRALECREAPPSPNKKYVYLNPGFLLFTGICVIEMASYLLL